MTCTSDHSALAIGATCPECGDFAQSASATEGSAAAPTSAPSSFFANKKNKQITAVAAAVVLVIAGFIGFKVLKKSPAIPYLTQACAILGPVKADKLSVNDEEKVISQVESLINTAESLDAGKSQAVVKVFADFKQMYSDHDANNRRFALMIALSDYSTLSSIRVELARIIEVGKQINADIKVACAPYL